jgi:hypothetical protein
MKEQPSIPSSERKFLYRNNGSLIKTIPENLLSETKSN